METRKFIKKPVVIEAYQITLELIEGILFDEKPYPDGLKLHSASYHKDRRTINSWFGGVVTIHEQTTTVVIGDWIVTEPDGKHHYPIKPDIFKETYSPHDTPPHNQD